MAQAPAAAMGADAPLASFASALGLDAEDLRASIDVPYPRFIRAVHRGLGAPLVTLDEIRAALGDVASTATECAWLPGIFIVDSGAALARSTLYTSGRVAGIDASSAAAAFVLDPQPGEDVLDLCCAPGNKTALLAELMDHQGWLCGVDISPERLGAACTVLRRLGTVCPGGPPLPHWRLQLFCADGTSFPEEAAGSAAASPVTQHLCARCPLRLASHDSKASVPILDSWVESLLRSRDSTPRRGLPPPLRQQQISNLMQQRRHRAGAPRGEPERECNRCLALNSETHCCDCPVLGAARNGGPPLFDRVLVDAECTHDGSAKHLAKFGTQWGWESFERRVLDEGRLVGLEALQRSLLMCVQLNRRGGGRVCADNRTLLHDCRNGFRLLRVGGTLVYSTCSLTDAQNEAIVKWLFATCLDSRIVPIDPEEITLAAARWARSGGSVQSDRPQTHEAAARGDSDVGTSSASGCATSPCPAAPGASVLPVSALPEGDGLFHHVHGSILPPCIAGGIPGTIRFSPLMSGGAGGLFVCRITKVHRY